MVIKVYISGISGNKEVKKRQQRVLLILDSKNIEYEVVDIAEPGNEEAKEFMQNNAKSMGATIGDPNPKHALPPQIFNDSEYCGDYDMFDLANEIDEIEKFLKLPVVDSSVASNTEIKLENGEVPVVENAKGEEEQQNGEKEEQVTQEEKPETNETEKNEVEENKTNEENEAKLGEGDGERAKSEEKEESKKAVEENETSIGNGTAEAGDS